jgi:predicted phage tail protein
MGDEMSLEEKLIAEMDARLAQALDARPVAAVPADFAARVARQMPARRPVLLTPRHYGRNAMVVCMVVLGVALLLVAALHAGTVSAAVEATVCILCAQFLGLVVWLGMKDGLWRMG